MTQLNIADLTTPLAANAPWIDALISSTSTANWNWLVPAPTVLRYTFNVAADAAASLNVSTTPTGAFGAAQRDAARQVLSYVTTVTGIAFQETTSSQADLHFGTADIDDPDIAGEAVWHLSYEYDPATGVVTSSDLKQYVFLDDREHLSSNTVPSPGTSGYEVLLHEVGHTLGLKHPFEGSPQLPGELENTSQTVMSYTHVGGPYTAFNELDLSALAYLYGGDGINGNWGVGGPGEYYRGTSGNESFTAGNGLFAWVGLGGTDTVSLPRTLQSSSLSVGPGNAWILIAQSGSTNYVASDIETLAFPDNTISYSELLRGAQVASHTRFGTAGPDTVSGTPGNDVFFGRGSNDVFDGLSGLDAAIYQGARASYGINITGGGSNRRADVLELRPTNDGSDTLSGVERLRFTDMSVALDLDGAAGMTAKLLGALFGPGFVQNRSFVGIGLQLFDSGLTYTDVAGRAAADPFFTQLAGSQSNADFVRHVYRNVTGVLPGTDELNFYAGLLASGTHTKGSLGVLAAETPGNQLNIDLIGLQQHGLEYV